MASKNGLEQTNTLFDNRIMRLKEVASVFGYSEAHIYRLVKQKKIPYRKIGRNLFFIEKEVFSWFNNEGEF